MRIEGDWLAHPGTRAVLAMLEKAGHQALFVGGCVRNAALGEPVSDIDIASDATPEQVMELAEADGLKAIGTGVDHGTVTVVAKGRPHEVTTFRRDVETDGRRAVVAFSNDIFEDAARRDFTMNALYARGDGTVLDPTGQGATDLQAARLRFIGRPEDRIREDYLRILRYFRFHAWYADTDAGFDPDALAAISSLSGGLETISRERIGHEMRKLLAARDPAPELATMDRIGLLQRVLKGTNPENVARLVHVEERHKLDRDWLARLAALGGEGAGDALRLARREATRLEKLRAGLASAESPGLLGYRLGRQTAVAVLALRAALLEEHLSAADFEAIEAGEAAVFPVRAADLPPDLSGPAIGEMLHELETRWIESGFALSRDELLA